MQGLKILVIVMGVMIVAGVAVVIGTIVQRAGGGTAPPTLADTLLDEPAGTRIAGVTATADRLAVQLQGGGADRVLLLDPRSGRVLGRVALAR